MDYEYNIGDTFYITIGNKRHRAVIIDILYGVEPSIRYKIDVADLGFIIFAGDDRIDYWRNK